jgi:hypothetical protein
MVHVSRVKIQYFITDLSMEAIMHTKPKVAGHPVTAWVLQSVMKNALCLLYPGMGGGRPVQLPGAAESKEQQNEWQN